MIFARIFASRRGIFIFLTKNIKLYCKIFLSQQMLAPGYYHMECQTKEDCTKKNPKSFCHMFMCVDCLKENVACTQNGQCCDGTECIYGRCKKGAKKDPGMKSFRPLWIQIRFIVHFHPSIFPRTSFLQEDGTSYQPKLNQDLFWDRIPNLILH